MSAPKTRQPKVANLAHAFTRGPSGDKATLVIEARDERAVRSVERVLAMATSTFGKEGLTHDLLRCLERGIQEELDARQRQRDLFDESQDAANSE